MLTVTFPEDWTRNHKPSKQPQANASADEQPGKQLGPGPLDRPLDRPLHPPAHFQCGSLASQQTQRPTNTQAPSFMLQLQQELQLQTSLTVLPHDSPSDFQGT